MARHLAQVNDRTGLIVMCVLFSITSTTAVVLRFYSRKLKGLKYQMDDWLAAIALVFVLALNGEFMAGCIQHVITGHSPVVDNWPVSTPKEHLAEKYKYGFQTTEKLAFGIIKLSILFLWRRIFGHIRVFNIASWCVIAFTAAWSIAFFFATVFQCGTNWELNWAPMIDFLTKCTNTLNMLTVFTATDVFGDIVIIAMPIPMIWRLQMSTQRKLAINAMFLVGLFTIGAGAARMYSYLGTSYGISQNPDFIADFTIFLLWSIIELNVAMLCACMPTLLPVLMRLPERLRSWRTSGRLLSFSRRRTTARSHDNKDKLSSTSSVNQLYDQDFGRDNGKHDLSSEEMGSSGYSRIDLEMRPPNAIIVENYWNRHESAV